MGDFIFCIVQLFFFSFVVAESVLEAGLDQKFVVSRGGVFAANVGHSFYHISFEQKLLEFGVLLSRTKGGLDCELELKEFWRHGFEHEHELVLGEVDSGVVFLLFGFEG